MIQRMGTTFLAWKSKITPILKSLNLWDHHHDCPKETPAAFYEIGLSLNTSQIEQVISCTTAPDIWRALEKEHNSKAICNIFLLKRKLFSVKLKDRADISTLINEIERIAQELADFGHPVNNIDKICIFLSALPSAHNSLVRTLTNKVTLQTTFDQVSTLVLKEDL